MNEAIGIWIREHYILTFILCAIATGSASVVAQKILYTIAVLVRGWPYGGK